MLKVMTISLILIIVKTLKNNKIMWKMSIKIINQTTTIGNWYKHGIRKLRQDQKITCYGTITSVGNDEIFQRKPLLICQRLSMHI